MIQSIGVRWNDVLLQGGSGLAAMHLIDQLSMSSSDPLKQQNLQMMSFMGRAAVVAVVFTSPRELSPELKIFILVFAQSALHIAKRVLVAEKAQQPNFITEILPDENYIPLTGVDDIIADLETVMNSRKRPNAVLLGKTGIGKTSIIKEIVHRQKTKQIDGPWTLSKKRFFEFDSNAVIGDATLMGMWNGRLKKLFDFLEINPDIVIFMDEVHLIMGMGKSINSTDSVAQQLKTRLTGGQIKIIAATTEQDYDRDLRADVAFTRRFKPIYLEEPKQDTCIEIFKKELEQYPGWEFDEEALTAIWFFTNLLNPDEAQPSKGLVLLDSVATRHQENKKVGVDEVATVYAREVRQTKDSLLELWENRRKESAILNFLRKNTKQRTSQGFSNQFQNFSSNWSLCQDL